LGSPRKASRPIKRCGRKGLAKVATKKKPAAKPSGLQQRIKSWMLSHQLAGEPIDICPGARLIAISRSPFNLQELIDDGRFSPALSQALRSLILEPHRTGRPMPDHEMRFVAGNGFWYGIYSVARAGHHGLVMLAFERGQEAIDEAAKAKMFEVSCDGSPACAGAAGWRASQFGKGGAMIGDLEQRVLEWGEIRKRLANSSAYRAGWAAARQVKGVKPLPLGVLRSLARHGFGLEECEHQVRVHTGHAWCCAECSAQILDEWNKQK
jgi:hypothetical protein